ncbi:hypothetical protein MSM1_01630 [Mycobacterium sp. SM1]|uniref:hypothetical protein n=1 Tax=Mycobacterium sp. SM1 TaxID=2816243 RepID=UPI001BD033E7|nr:hypothetical protein [Mycobacterium sp. SM1]MBS4727121.1 hypothetical protein [Mycobacterium sp. SM1]
MRGNSAFGTNKVFTTCVSQGAEFSLSVRSKRITTAIQAIDEAAYTIRVDLALRVCPAHWFGPARLDGRADPTRQRAMDLAEGPALAHHGNRRWEVGTVTPNSGGKFP